MRKQKTISTYLSPQANEFLRCRHAGRLVAAMIDLLAESNSLSAARLQRRIQAIIKESVHDKYKGESK